MLAWEIWICRVDRMSQQIWMCPWLAIYQPNLGTESLFYLVVRYTYAGDEIPLIKSAPPPVTEITQNHKCDNVQCQLNKFLLGEPKCGS